MMKILFVEDEISKNIPRIIRLFSKYLGETRIDQLKKLEEDESGYGADPVAVKNIVESTNMIDLEYCFSGALNKIIRNYKKYSMFIIDRNLVQEEYDFEDIKEIDSNFTEKQFETFWEREGDYLLQKLVYLGIDVMAKFYFLTAYSYENEIKSADNIRTHIDFGKFTSTNFVEKSSSVEINSLKELIENIDVLNIQMENEEYLNILREYLSSEICDSFIEVLTEKDSDKRKDIEQNLGLLRKILENILAVLAYRLNVPDECKSRNGIKVRKVIKWLLGGKKEETGTIYSYPYFTNGLIKNYLYNTYEISSDFGIHPDYNQKSENESKGYQPTSNTVNSLIFSMKEIILWFGRALEN